MPFGIGVRFFSVHFCSLPELQETGTTLKHWNRTTEYVKTKCVHELVPEIHAVVCKLKNCKIAEASQNPDTM